MFIKQISIFVENKKGRLAEITKILSDNDIDIRALSIADTKDFGILRLIVNKPEQAATALKEAGLTVSITNVIAVAVDDKTGALAGLMEKISTTELSIEYMYAFIGSNNGKAYIILRVDDNEKSVEIFSKNGIVVVCEKEIY
ncbi:MAG: ACT domain-containing protein [Oscillospiraceae bacterium]